jgi:hypothetical protein
MAFLLLSTTSFAQDWGKVSRDEITRNGKASIAVGNNDVIYAAYDDASSGRQLTVAQIKNGKVSKIGTGLSKTAAINPTVITAPNGDPVVASLEYIGSTVTVSRMQDGKRWSTVGNGPITADKLNSFGLAFDKNGVLYAAVGNTTQQTTVVYKLENDSWKEVALLEGGASNQIKLAFDSKNQLLMAYAHPKGKKAVLMTLKDGKMITLGEASKQEVKYLSLALNGDKPVISYMDYFSGALEVKEFTNNKWEAYAPAIVQNFDESSLALAADGTPYVSFHYYKKDHETKVMRFKDGAWQQVGDLNAAFGTTGYYTSLQCKDNKLFLCTKADGVGATVVTTTL